MLQTLELQHVRSYTNGLFEFTKGVNIVVGPNASGKTNLLEAIYMVCQGSAFKSSDEHMVRNGSEWARINAMFKEESRSVKIQTAPLKKSFVIEDVNKKRLTQTYTLPVVLFEPGHMLLLSNEPERRRAYIDTVLKTTQPTFSESTRKYKRALAQRNRLLKQENVRPEDMFIWDMQLCEHAGSIVKARQEYITEANKHLTARYRSVSGNKENLQLHYDSIIQQDNYANAFAIQLKESFALDKIRGFTSAGPHRDDMQILLNEKDARNSASRGETRSIVLALKITELELVKEHSDKTPLLLLDDVFSELDGKRRRTLANTLQNYQTFITTTDADVVMEHFTTCNIIPL